MRSLLAIAFSCLLFAPAYAGILDAEWSPPTTNTDGTPLTDLAGFRVYYSPQPAPCPASGYLPLTATSPTPHAGDVATTQLTGLTTGVLYYVQVTAFDLTGLQSACSGSVSAIARAETLPPPPPPPPLDTTAPAISITSSAVFQHTATIKGQASDNVGVVKVTWISSRGASGTASGTTSWTVAAPAPNGWTTYSIVAADAAGNQKSVTVRLKGH